MGRLICDEIFFLHLENAKFDVNVRDLLGLGHFFKVCTILVFVDCQVKKREKSFDDQNVLRNEMNETRIM